MVRRDLIKFMDDYIYKDIVCQSVAGVVLSDQVKSLWRARSAEQIGPVPPRVTDEVLKKLATLLE